MKFVIIILSLACLSVLASCINKQPKEQSNLKTKNRPSVQDLKKSLLDSITKLSFLTQATYRDDSDWFVYYIDEINNQKLGVIAITDSVIFVFQKINKKWIQMDSTKFDDYSKSISIEDVNNDNLNDLILYRFTEAHGNAKPLIFLSDKKGRLHYRPDINLWNFKCNKSSGFIRSDYMGSAYGIHFREIYRWVNDSLQLIRGAELNLSSANTGLTTVTFYTLKNGKRFNYKKLPDPKEIIYDTAVWKDEF